MSIIFDIGEPTKFVIGGRIYTLNEAKEYLNNLSQLIDIADKKVNEKKFVPTFVDEVGNIMTWFSNSVKKEILDVV